MATAQLYLPCDGSTPADFTAFGQGVSNQLTSAGWTKTADTGQVDWTTTPACPPANTWTLYEIRQNATDPLQTGSTKFYVRIGYGQRGGNYPTLRITLGTGTDGAGNLTGSVTTPALAGPPNSGQNPTGSIPFECDFSWDKSRLAALLWRNNTAGNTTGFFAIERTKANDGTDNTDGVSVFVNCSTANPSIFQQTIVFGSSGGVTPALNGFGIIQPTPTGNYGLSNNFNNSIPVSPCFPCYGKWCNPQTVLAAAYSADIQDGAFMKTTIYGAQVTYLMTKAIGMIWGGAINENLLMRFD